MTDEDMGDAIPSSNGEGWDYFAKANEKAMQEARKIAEMKQKEIDRAFARMASTPDGAIVLRAMQGWVDGMDDFNPSLGFHNGAAFGFWCTGNRNFLRLTQQAITRGGQ
jgi:hypothetical protein